MEAARALADLVEVSPQIEAATVFGGDAQPLGSIGVTDWWATAVARAGRLLLASAAAYRSDGGKLTQLHASLRDGDVFAVGDPSELAIVAVTRPKQAAGLLFYDLKRCLASLDASEPQQKAAPEPEQPAQRRRWAVRRKGDA